jgi:hypothetical protein
MATYKDKQDRILKVMSERAGFSSLVPGTKGYQLAEAFAYEQMLQESEIEEFTRKNSILTAKKQELDDIGENFFNVKRLGNIKPFITSSMKALKFYVDTAQSFGQINVIKQAGIEIPQDIIIPEGVIISGTKDGIDYKFRVSKTTILPKDDNVAYVQAELMQGPLAQIPANILKMHSFTKYTQATSNMLKVTNPVPVMNGRQSESDDNYRFRVSNALSAFPRTNTTAIHQLLTELPAISNVYIEPSSNGGGTFTVYVQGTTPITGDEIIREAEMVLERVISPWIVSYTVVKPSYIGIQASIDMVLRDSFNSNITSLISQKVTNYLDNFDGDTFYINSILSLVQGMHQDILDVSFNYVRVYSGSEDIRSYEELDFTVNPNPIISISIKEKLISEPISNPITLTITV